ncbi:MAG: hypothetical protein M3155_01135 [Actinomycetota bacterium]|nr:hypothetical protein [Actinomycetota bacterium]
MRAGLVLATLAGPVLLIVADFTTLFEVRGPGYLHGVLGHANHAFAMVVIGVVALGLAVAALRVPTPVALGALAVLGVVAGVIAVGFDLSDATVKGTLSNFQQAQGTPRVGFYLETLGAALLLVAGVGGILLAAPARRVER